MTCRFSFWDILIFWERFNIKENRNYPYWAWLDPGWTCSRYEHLSAPGILCYQDCGDSLQVQVHHGGLATRWGVVAILGIYKHVARAEAMDLIGQTNFPTDPWRVFYRYSTDYYLTNVMGNFSRNCQDPNQGRLLKCQNYMPPSLPVKILSERDFLKNKYKPIWKFASHDICYSTSADI
jgi:hypothetical protein